MKDELLYSKRYSGAFKDIKKPLNQLNHDFTYTVKEVLVMLKHVLFS